MKPQTITGSLHSRKTELNQLQNLLNETESRTMTNKEIQEMIYRSLDLLRNCEASPEITTTKKALAESLDALHRLDYVSTKDFTGMYFDALPEFETPKEAFQAVNDYHLEAFGEKKYKSHKEFKAATGMN